MMTDSTIERARVLAGLQKKLEGLSKNYTGVERRAHPREERSLPVDEEFTGVTVEEKAALVVVPRDAALKILVKNLDEWPVFYIPQAAVIGWRWHVAALGKFSFQNEDSTVTSIYETDWQQAREETREEKAALVDDFGMPDMVNKPPHYQIMPGVEVIDVRKALMDKIPPNVPYSQVDDWSRAWEYLTRMWGKNGLEDAEKARFYLNRLIDGMGE